MSSENAGSRLLGLLGSWALFALGFGWASIAVAGQWINVKDARKLERYASIEKLLGWRVSARSIELRQARQRSESSRKLTRSKMATASRMDFQAPGKAASFPATGAPPDGYFVELARKHGLDVLRLAPGQAIDADTGRAAQRTGGGVWDWVGAPSSARRVLTVENGTVVEFSRGTRKELPPGALIRAGDTLVIPPSGSPQRRFDTVPLDMDAPPEKPGEKPSAKAAEADAPPKRRGTLWEKGESIFGRK